jgi:hypothetical protein
LSFNTNEDESYKEFNKEEKEVDDSPTKRDDLLHKKNLECYNELFKKSDIKSFSVCIRSMISDMVGENN